MWLGEGDQCHGAYDCAISRYATTETIMSSSTCWVALHVDPFAITTLTITQQCALCQEINGWRNGTSATAPTTAPSCATRPSKPSCQAVRAGLLSLLIRFSLPSLTITQHRAFCQEIHGSGKGTSAMAPTTAPSCTNHRNYLVKRYVLVFVLLNTTRYCTLCQEISGCGKGTSATAPTTAPYCATPPSKTIIIVQ